MTAPFLRRAAARANPLLLLLAGLALLRLVGMHWLPLMDTTEARYGEIGRKMAQLGDWITPWHDVGVPFWGKPPLSFWLTAASFKAFGIGEFSARLPHFLCGVAIAVVVWALARRQSRDESWFAVALLAGSALFFVSAGAVMTDAALVLASTLAMAGFWWGITARRRSPHPASWLLFFGMALGLLAKGPLALVLIATPALLWTVTQRRVRALSGAFPWATGLGLILVLVLPWYAAAELRTPGFLNYFLAGEHWHRFLTPGWKGDLYGNAHEFPRGTIWVFAVAATAPWCVLLPFAAGYRRWRGHAALTAPVEGSWVQFLAFWALTPLVFFTAARNIIWTYALPALPAAALLAAHWLARWRGPLARRLVCTGMLLTAAAAFVIAQQASDASGRIQQHSAKALVHAYAQSCRQLPLLYVGARSFSMDFYSAGRGQHVNDLRQLPERIDGREVCLVTPQRDAGKLPLPEQMAARSLARIGGSTLLRIERVQANGSQSLASARGASSTGQPH